MLATGLSRPAKIVLGGVLWGALVFLIGLYFTQDIRDGIDPKGFVPPSVWGRIPDGLFLLLFLPYIGAFLIGVVSLFRRKFLNAICLIGVAYSIHVPTYALDAIRGDRTRFTDGPHREIADIYHQRHADFVSPGPRLVPLDDQCHPPNWCTCWVLGGKSTYGPVLFCPTNSHSSGPYPTGQSFNTTSISRYLSVCPE